MVDVFDEVEEELRREKLNEVYRKWAPWVIGGALAIVVGVAGQQFWSHQTRTAAESSSEAYIAASLLVEEGDLAGARAAFTQMAEGSSAGYAALSYLRLGEIAIAENEPEEAARYFQQAASRSSDQLMRDVAEYKAALALFDTLSYDDLSVRLTPLTEGDAPMGVLARELIAAAAIRDERWDEARSQYRLLGFGDDLLPGMRDQITATGEGLEAGRQTQALAYIALNAPEVIPEMPEAASADPVEAEPALDPDSPANPDSETTETEEGGQ